MIYRSASEVNWDKDGMFLYSPKPREWTYFEWYKHIISLIQTDCECQLVLTPETKWINIDNELKWQIEKYNKNERTTGRYMQLAFRTARTFWLKRTVK